MKSRITIEMDFSNAEPFIKVVNDTMSDDLRDKTVSFFREKFGYTSSWAKVIFNPLIGVPLDNTIFIIKPITPEELNEEARIMLSQSLINRDIKTTND